MIRVGVVLFAGLVSGFPAIAEVATAQADGVVLRTLDKVSGAVIDRTLLQETTSQVGNLAVTLNECRYPLDNPAGDAFRSEEHTSELQSHHSISYAVFCLKKNLQTCSCKKLF